MEKTMSSPTRAEAVAELEERVRDTLYAEFAELGQVDLDVVNYIASRITNTILREGEEGKGVSDSEIRFEFFFLFSFVFSSLLFALFSRRPVCACVGESLGCDGI